MNLFLLPFAGGSKYAYWKYSKYTPDHLTTFPIEIPGRGSRANESLLTDAKSLTDDIYLQICQYIDEPYALYGHSMGGILCYMLTKKIRQKKGRLPEHFFLTGCEGPSVVSEKDSSSLPTDLFKKKLLKMGGCPQDVLNNEDLFSFYEPILRADFQVVESFKYEPSEPFDIPMTVIIGTEEKITLENAKKWSDETINAVNVYQLPGNHFFIFNQEKEIMKIIDNKLKIE